MIRTGTETQSHGIVATGTKICGTVPLLKSCGTTNPYSSGQEFQSVQDVSVVPGFYVTQISFSPAVPEFNLTRVPFCPGAFCETSGTGKNFRGTVSHGCPAGQARPGQNIAEPSRPFLIPGIYKYYTSNDNPNILAVSQIK